MPHSRFEQISANLHFSNNVQLNKQDRLWKPRLVIDLFSYRFSLVYVPDQHFSTDESLRKFRGHLSFYMYNPSKHAHFGIKVYKLLLAGRYTTAFKVYTGEDKGDLPSSQMVDLVGQELFWQGLYFFLWMIGIHLP
ncbi:uncharacterized protein LOC143033312 isoform X1 [Oratosquilla oratoria]|uniref:uncharacterized protein LOC143033312 isoform X1 n=1 Tax=Oratosquilla oratoria TaxID=337810 RepID=UPI003F75E49E